MASSAISPAGSAATLLLPPHNIQLVSQPVNTEPRRAANYGSNFWDFDFLQTLESAHSTPEEENMRAEVAKLAEEARSMIMSDGMPTLSKLELVDTLQRLGLKHRFQEEINQALASIPLLEIADSDLYTTSLGFRLLREHGIFVSQDFLKKFKGEDGKFTDELQEDVKGLLSLYEASFLGLEGEEVVDEAMAFATSSLKLLLRGHAIEHSQWEERVECALDMPLHWRLPRVEARWFMEAYCKEENSNPTLHKLAVLDFNMLQSLHRKEIGKLSRWWVDMGLDKLNFGRNCLVESYMFCYGMVFEPQYSRVREVGTQIVALITTIDDIYDTYGSMDELKLFTDFANRWDISEIDRLPKNIKICFLAMYNNCNEIGYHTLKERGYNIIPYLRKAWADLLNSYLREAQWYHEGYKPTLEEYMENALVSIGVHPVILSNYCLSARDLTKDSLDHVDSIPPLLRTTDVIFRLLNDMGTSSYELVRGDTLKALQCYMHHAGASEEVARGYIMGMVRELWKKVNASVFEISQRFSHAFVEANINSIRAAQFFYQNGDGYGAEPENLTKHHLLSLLFNPVQLQ